MARPIYQHELADPDIQWLMSSYREANPNVAVIETACLPVIMILLEEASPPIVEEEETTEQAPPMTSPSAGDDGAPAEEPDR